MLIEYKVQMENGICVLIRTHSVLLYHHFRRNVKTFKEIIVHFFRRRDNFRSSFLFYAHFFIYFIFSDLVTLLSWGRF